MTTIAPLKNWYVREATADDVRGLNDLFRDVYGGERSDAAIRWRYFENPAGAPIIMVAEADGRVIGQRILWPTHLRLGSENVLGAQSVDAMTHPGFRRQGIHVQLAHAARQEAIRRGVEVLYGFPNDQSLNVDTTRL